MALFKMLIRLIFSFNLIFFVFFIIANTINNIDCFKFLIAKNLKYDFLTNYIFISIYKIYFFSKLLKVIFIFLLFLLIYIIITLTLKLILMFKN